MDKSKSEQRDELIESFHQTLIAEARMITPKDLASELSIDAKVLRSFIRNHVTNRAGKGGAWRFTSAEAERIKRAYTNRKTIQATAPIFADDSFGQAD